MIKNETWGLVQVEREVRWLSRLSPDEIYALAPSLKRSRNPALKLSKLINELGFARREKLRKDIAQEARLIRNPKLWELPHLALISQPWVSELSGEQYARIFPDSPLTVRCKSNGEPDTTFASAEEMLQIWRLD